MSSAGLRGHEFKLYKPQAHLDIRKIFLPLDLLMSFYWDVRPTSPYPTSCIVILSTATVTMASGINFYS